MIHSMGILVLNEFFGWRWLLASNCMAINSGTIITKKTKVYALATSGALMHNYLPSPQVMSLSLVYSIQVRLNSPTDRVITINEPANIPDLALGNTT